MTEPRSSDRMDRWLRWLLGVPGVLLEWLEPGPTVDSGAVDDPMLRERVRRGAHWPEAHLALEDGLQIHETNGDVLAYQRRAATVFGIGGLNSDDPVRLLQSFRERIGGVRRHLLFPVREAELPAVHRAGFQTVQVGVEAWLDLQGLTWRGRRYEEVRHLRNKAVRAGLAPRFEDVANVRDELAEIHEAWLASKRPSWRMKLLVGSPGLRDPGDRRYVVAAAEGRIEAFITLLPGAVGDWGVDVICRRPEAPSGAVELLILHAVAQLQSEGASRLSLGPCPMADVQHPGLLGALFRGLYGSWWGNRIFGFRNLHRFKKKFRPTWTPVHLAAAPRLGWFELYVGCRMWGLY